MPRIFMSASRFNLNADKFTKKLEDRIKAQMRQAAREFVKAALYSAVQSVKTGGFPVDSGMSKGAYLNISRALNIAMSVAPTSLKQKRYYGLNAYGAIKSPELGSQLSIEFAGRDTVIKKRGGSFYFEFWTSVLQYTINEFTGTKQPDSPWNTFEVGRQAFMDYMRDTGIRGLPMVSNYIERTKIQVSPTGGVTENKIPIVENIERISSED